MFKALLAMRGKPQFFIWVLLPLILLLNIGFDYRHPAFLVVDGLLVLIVAIVLFKSWLRKRL